MASSPALYSRVSDTADKGHFLLVNLLGCSSSRSLHAIFSHLVLAIPAFLCSSCKASCLRASEKKAPACVPLFRRSLPQLLPPSPDLLENSFPIHHTQNAESEDIIRVGAIQKKTPCTCHHSRTGRVQMCVPCILNYSKSQECFLRRSKENGQEKKSSDRQVPVFRESSRRLHPVTRTSEASTRGWAAACL